MKPHSCETRRDFLKTTLTGGVAALMAGRLVRSAMAAAPAEAPAAVAGGPTKVALTNGDNRTDNVVRALKSVEKEIVAAIGNRRVVIKPNLVTDTVALACGRDCGDPGFPQGDWQTRQRYHCGVFGQLHAARLSTSRLSWPGRPVQDQAR